MNSDGEMIRSLDVTPCEGRVSRNSHIVPTWELPHVTPCEGRVSRNLNSDGEMIRSLGHALRGACE